MTDPQARDVAVRIGELHALEPGAATRLVAVGLGSCVGVAIVDEHGGASALAHVFLPERPADGARAGAGAGTYADRAIPELARLVRGGATASTASSLIAVIAGGARMFGARPGSDVGARNVVAVREALERAGIRIVAEDVGGSHGRTMRVEGGRRPRISVRAVGSPERDLWSAQPIEPAAERLAA